MKLSLSAFLNALDDVFILQFKIVLMGQVRG